MAAWQIRVAALLGLAGLVWLGIREFGFTQTAFSLAVITALVALDKWFRDRRSGRKRNRSRAGKSAGELREDR